MKKALSIGAFCAVCVLFALYRLPSLFAHYVVYTYDQGRDFIAAANIILLHNIPFIGPTTGINGLFHGSWWYYLLTIPYLIFQGAPIGFYWFNFFIQFVSLVVLMLFLRREYGFLVSLLFGLFIVIAPYFNLMSLFVGNNSMVLPSLLIFLICNYYLFKNKQVSLLLLFITGLSLAFISEFELSFGIFLIPLYVGAIFLFPALRKTFHHKGGFFFLSGLIIGFLPRILFELKNSFSQTKALFSFVFHPKLYNSPAPYLTRVGERWILFKDYYFTMFSERYFAYVFLISIIIITGITVISVIKNRTKISSHFFFYSYLLGGLYFLSIFYTDFFWSNYYEGIQYIYLFMCISLIGQIIHKNLLLYKRVILFSLLLGLSLINSMSLKTSFSNKVPFDGLQVHEEVIRYIAKNQDLKKDYCIRIYTPSVIPHTYNYLFLVNKINPSSEWVNGTCWFIVEADYQRETDSFKSRRKIWLETNKPKDKNTVAIKKIKDIEVYYYEVLPK